VQIAKQLFQNFHSELLGYRISNGGAARGDLVDACICDNCTQRIKKSQARRASIRYMTMTWLSPNVK
jgi:hypothetical protein